MILSALLAATLATPALCPGDLSYAREISRAASELGVYNQLYVQVVPNNQAPIAVSPDGTVGGVAIAWVPRYPTFDWTIFIRFDMLHAMSCDALRLSALHEVCHIKLTHYDRRVNLAEAVTHEKQADACVQQVLNSYQWKLYNTDLVDAYLLARRERIEPRDPNYFTARRRVAVPNFYVQVR
jgi:hypothetical protein